MSEETAQDSSLISVGVSFARCRLPIGSGASRSKPATKRVVDDVRSLENNATAFWSVLSRLCWLAGGSYHSLTPMANVACAGVLGSSSPASERWPHLIPTYAGSRVGVEC